MSLSESEKAVIRETVDGFVLKERSFTAFTITQALKGKLDKPHHQVKKIVHEEFFNGSMGEYLRTSVQIPGAPGPAFLYHLPENEPSSWLATFDQDDDDDDVVNTGTSADDKDEDGKTLLKMSSDHRLYLPTRIAKQWKLRVGAHALCVYDGGRLIVRKRFANAKQSMIAVAVPVDVKGNIRVQGDAVNGVDTTPGTKFVMEEVGDEVRLEEKN